MVLMAAAALCGCEPKPLTWQDGSLKLKPKGEDEVTIALGRVGGANHSRQAAQWRDEIESETRWKGVFVVDQEGFSQMCWNKYPSIEAARGDLKKAKEYVRNDGTHTWKPFASAAIQQLPGKSVGPAEWDLTQQNDMYVFTVEVGIFYDVPDADPPYMGRKDIAVAYCKELREDGLEAYFFHGPSQSSVTIGLFTKTSMRETKAAGDDGIKRAPILTIVDERIRKILTSDRFKFICVNGKTELLPALDPQTGKPKVDSKGKPVKISRPSAVMQIAKGKPGAAQPAAAPAPDNQLDLMTLP